MSEDFNYLDVKCLASGISKGKAKDLVEQGISGVISGGPISDSSKKIFDDKGIWYRENVEPSDLEFEGREFEKEG
jgi:hypothetical protein